MNLDRLLRPGSIAVIGGQPAHEVIRQNDRLGFVGEIFPVHPTHTTVAGRKVYRSVADLPSPPDAVFLALNRHSTIETVGTLRAMGAGGVVCYASGFAESGEDGQALQQSLRDAAGDMPVLGPNCYGTLNYLDGAALWPDQHGGRRVRRGVAIVTQSGNIGLNLTMQQRALPIAYLVTLGNQAVIGLSHAIAALATDERITAIGLHIEGIDNPTAFAEAVACAARRGVPVVAIKTGASAMGAALTLSHTASMASPDLVAEAFLHRTGVARVRTLPELLETLKLLHVHGRLPSADLASMSCSGGEAALVADRAEGRQVRFRPFSDAERRSVTATVPALVTVSNPFDYHTFHWGNRGALAATFAAVMQSDVSLTMLILDFPRRDRGRDDDWLVAVHALSDAVQATGRRAAVVAALPECLPEARAEELMELGIAPLCGLDEALVACEAAVLPRPRLPVTAPPPKGRARMLDEWQSKQLLAASGVQIPAGTRATSAAHALAPCYPAAVKALGIAHKTERRALRLGLADARAVDDAARALEALGSGLLVEAMVQDGVAELIVGIARDPLGAFLLIGSGGVMAEIAADRVILMLPASADEVASAIASLKVAHLLAGHRGRRAGNVQAAIAAVLAIQAVALACIDTLLELEVNPLIVTPDAAIAADALVRLVEPDHV